MTMEIGSAIDVAMTATVRKPSPTLTGVRRERGASDEENPVSSITRPVRSVAAIPTCALAASAPDLGKQTTGGRVS